LHLSFEREELMENYTGADLIADFIAQHLSPQVYLVTGGACAFMVDAIGRNKKVDFYCFQHEQAAAMAADAVWRTTGKMGVTMATSGPGATNLITGIACSWFDSIPSFHITGQVNQSESREALGANVRQAGFQETDIGTIVSPITKWSHKVESIEDLIFSLRKAFEIATTGRMGPVLLDIPMNIQKAFVTKADKEKALANFYFNNKDKVEKNDMLSLFLANSERPLVVIGAGLALTGNALVVQDWCESLSIPYVTSWGALTYIDRSRKGYQGSLGVYGSRRANWTVQAADKILVLGSRLDNRQRTGNPAGFAPFADILVLDIDVEELKKYHGLKNYAVAEVDLSKIAGFLPELIDDFELAEWNQTILDVPGKIEDGFSAASSSADLNPYFAARKIQEKFSPSSIVVSDCGANLCWVYQSFEADNSFLFTAGGNSPMGYSLPAAIGAQLSQPEKTVYCLIGDGGFQMNLQELQTVVHYQLPIKIIIQNNFGYGIIKQFQDAYFDSRYYATGEGYSLPDFQKISLAYGIPYIGVETLEEITAIEFLDGPMIIDMKFGPNSLITPKTEMDRFIHDQFPYINDGSIQKLPYKYPDRPSKLGGTTVSTV
jgi:acetolactate synthase-1/2/3 large subunit